MQKEIKCFKINSKYFPPKLNELEKCPKELFVLGDEKILLENSLGVIGSRNCSCIGKEVAQKICLDLSESNVVIVSGFAKGIDTIAHKACLSNKKKTIAVLGSGHGRIYPSENRKIIDKILMYGGAIVSEYPFDYPALPKNFIERNRIIAALSEGVVLIEAKKNSGSLHTIKYARELNRKIFVVPGRVNDEMYEGSNEVLVNGAFCICNSKDIAKKYSWINLKEKVDDKSEMIIDKEYINLFDVISKNPISFEEICMLVNEPVNVILNKLTMLEMNDFIKEVECQKFIRTK